MLNKSKILSYHYTSLHQHQHHVRPFQWKVMRSLAWKWTSNLAYQTSLAAPRHFVWLMKVPYLACFICIPTFQGKTWTPCLPCEGHMELSLHELGKLSTQGFVTRSKNDIININLNKQNIFSFSFAKQCIIYFTTRKTLL